MVNDMRHLHLVESPPDEQMSHFQKHAANYGWAGLIAGVIVFDCLSPTTLSSQFDRYLDHPIGKYAAIGGVALLGAHLLNLPEAFGTPDPIDTINKLAQKAIIKIRGQQE